MPVLSPIYALAQHWLADTAFIRPVLGDNYASRINTPPTGESSLWEPPAIIFKITADRTNTNCPDLVVKEVEVRCYGQHNDQARELYTALDSWAKKTDKGAYGGAKVAQFVQIEEEEDGYDEDLRYDYVEAKFEAWLKPA